MFVAEFLAVRKRSSFRSLPGAALRSALGCKNVAAAGGASAVQSFKRRKTKGKACCFLHVACGGERVRLLCLVSVGVGASLRRWFAWASVRSLRQNWRWLKLARTQKSGLRGGPKFGAALPFWQLKVGPPRGPVIGPGERRSQKDYGGVAACECLRATPLSI